MSHAHPTAVAEEDEPDAAIGEMASDVGDYGSRIAAISANARWTRRRERQFLVRRELIEHAAG